MPSNRTTADKKQESGTSASSPKRFKSPDFRSVYANNAEFAMSLFDVSMLFGEMVGTDKETQELVIEQHVKVIMSPLHTKIFLNVLAHNLKQWEARFGELKIPPDSVTIAK